jgi:hypothetical protein
VYFGVWASIVIIAIVQTLASPTALPASYYTLLSVTFATTLVGTYSLATEVSPVSGRMEAQAPAGMALGLRWWNSTAIYLPRLYAVLLMPPDRLEKLKTGSVNWRTVR